MKIDIVGFSLTILMSFRKSVHLLSLSKPVLSSHLFEYELYITLSYKAANKENAAKGFCLTILVSSSYVL